jgi:flagellar hook-associated protein 3 FlgL
MRISSNTIPNLVISSSQSAQQQLAQLEQEISSGDSVTQASDNPLAYNQASQTQANLSQLNSYSNAITSATTATQLNNSAMTQLHQIIAQASEYATSVTSGTSATDLQNYGTQTQNLINELTSIVNQKDSSGNYLFGGTANQPPLTSAGAYNTATNGATLTTEVGQSNAVQTSIAAGRPGVDGFLYDTASGVDVLGTLQQAVTDMNSGNANAVITTDLPALNKALDHISMYVGSTAASMAAVTSAGTLNTQQITQESNHLNGLTQTNLPTASLQLQQVQNQYQASLEAGARILNLSIMNYLPTTTG